MSSLKEGMFEEIKVQEAKRILDSRRLGFSQLRLLPKGTKLRPIMNLRRRQMMDGKRARLLGPSINSLLKPIHAALKYETVCIINLLIPLLLLSRRESINEFKLTKRSS